MYFVYILKSKNFLKTYVGITNDIVRRLSQHNLGYNTFTKRYKPWDLIYKEKLANRVEAHKREIYFKSTTGRRWMKKNLFDNADVAELVYAQS